MNNRILKFLFTHRKLFFSVLILIFNINIFFTQVNYFNNDAWKWVHPGPQGNVLRWCKMWDSNNWYMVGNSGTFMKTSDGGSSWSINTHASIFIGAYTDVHDAYFFDQSNGILASDRGLTRTTDGGSTFAPIAGTSTSASWIALYFINNNTGIVTGGYGSGVSRLAKTTDGGITWTINAYLTTGSYNDIYTPDGNTILLAGGDGNLQKSTDAGVTWISIPTGITDPLNRLYFINNDSGFVAGRNGYFGFTSNGGDSWELRNTGLPASPFYDIDVRSIGSNKLIYLTGNKDYIYLSSNYGMTWDTIGFKEPDINSLDIGYLCTDLKGGDTLLTVGTFGLINKKVFSNTYYSYTRAARFGQALIYDVWAENENVWAVGQPTTVNSFNQILYSSNGGSSWSVQPTQNINDNILTGVQMLNASSGYSVGTNGSVLKTVNGGGNWYKLTLNTSNNLRSLKFLNVNTGWVFGNDNSIFKTTDGGLNWVQQTATGLNGNVINMCMINSNTGWIVANDNFYGFLYKTTDGGQNWENQIIPSVPALMDIQMFDENLGYICGNQVLMKTSNGGINWVNFANPYPNYFWMSMKFLSPDIGYVASFGYTTIKTTNGGQSWISDLMPSFLSNNQIGNCRIFVLSPDIVYSGSTWTGVLKYTTPNPIGITQWQNNMPLKYELYQNYPNPFNPSTTIKFAIPKQSKVTLKVYDITGRETMTIFDGIEMSSGTITHNFDGSELASGIYFYSLMIDGNLIDTKKMVLIK